MGGARWPRKWTGILLPPQHGADHLGQALVRLPHIPWFSHSRESSVPFTSSFSCLLPIHRLSVFCADLRLGAVGGWDQRSPLLLQPNVWGDDLGASRAAEPVPSNDGAHERAQVSRGWAGKDGLAALLWLPPLLAPPRGKAVNPV